MGPDARRDRRSGRGEAKDRRFAAPEWRDNPLFDTIRQSYLAISDRLLGSVEEIEGLDEETAPEAALRHAAASSMR